MELKEFIELLKSNLKLFLLILIGAVLISLVIFNYQKNLYIASIGVDIAREKEVPINNGDYQYDQFYRLQADEKFGQNIVSWLEDSSFNNLNRKDFEKSQIGSWGDVFGIKASQPSANYLKISFKSKDPRSAHLFGKVLKENLKERTGQLNFSQSDNWFKLIFSETYVTQNNPNIYIFLIVSFLLGFFLGFLAVLFKDYFQKNENRD
jgi:capsular polysaccharide biosynthesis protein